MRVRRRVDLDGPPPALHALLRSLLMGALAGVLVFSLGAAAHSGPDHKRVTHAAAVLAAVANDIGHGAPRAEHPGAGPSPAEPAVAFAGRVRTTDSSPRASSCTAQTPQVRGPPGEALA